jgi:hypothetical protein
VGNFGTLSAELITALTHTHTHTSETEKCVNSGLLWCDARRRGICLAGLGRKTHAIQWHQPGQFHELNKTFNFPSVTPFNAHPIGLYALLITLARSRLCTPRRWWVNHVVPLRSAPSPDIIIITRHDLSADAAAARDNNKNNNNRHHKLFFWCRYISRLRFKPN